MGESSVDSFIGESSVDSFIGESSVDSFIGESSVDSFIGLRTAPGSDDLLAFRAPDEDLWETPFF